MPLYRFRCTNDDSIHDLHLLYKDYKAILDCPCGKGQLKRIYDEFSTKEGRTVKQQNLGATEKRLDSGKWMKDETDKRKKNSHPESREAISSEYWLGNEFKNGEKKLTDF